MILLLLLLGFGLISCNPEINEEVVSLKEEQKENKAEIERLKKLYAGLDRQIRDLHIKSHTHNFSNIIHRSQLDSLHLVVRIQNLPSNISLRSIDALSEVEVKYQLPHVHHPIIRHYVDKSQSFEDFNASQYVDFNISENESLEAQRKLFIKDYEKHPDNYPKFFETRVKDIVEIDSYVLSLARELSRIDLLIWKKDQGLYRLKTIHPNIAGCLYNSVNFIHAVPDSIVIDYKCGDKSAIAGGRLQYKMDLDNGSISFLK